MSLRYNKKHLMEMLSRDDLDRDDKQAIRFALWSIAQLYVTEVMPPLPCFPYWRYVRYTDDGCALYQCLNCKKQFESRTEPGWMDHLEKTYDPAPAGAPTYEDGEYKKYWYRKREEPIYKVCMTYCPFCAIEWEGPISREENNEYMRGTKRLTRDRMVEDAQPPVGFTPNVDWWWVIQTRDVWPDRDGPFHWRDESKMNPARYNAIAAYDQLLQRRERCKEDDNHSAPMFAVKHEARLIRKSREEMNHPAYGGPREIY